MYAFGDARVRGAEQVVEWLESDPPQVLAIQEFTRRGDEDNRFATRAREYLAGLGYTASHVTDYTPYPNERNWYTMGLWSRIPGVTDDDISREAFGNRYGLCLHVPGFGDIVSVHLDDASEAVRQSAAEAIVGSTREADRAVVLGGYTAMHRRDPRSRLPRLLDPMARHIPIKDYYSGSKLHWKLSEVKRVAAMARGHTMQTFTDAGFADADPAYKPTVTCGPVAFKLDHILAAGAEVTKFGSIDMRGVTENGRRLSNHFPLAATVSYQTQAAQAA